MGTTVTVIDGIGELTPAWLTGALADTLDGARVTDIVVTPIGTGQVADTARIELTTEPAGAGPQAIVAKVSAADPTSRMAARFTRTYEIEAGFYRELAATLPVRSPRCYHAAHDVESDAYVVLLEDMAPATQGDQLAGCSVPEAERAIDELVRLHAPRWGDPTLADIGWLHRADPEAVGATAAIVASLTPGFMERYEARLDPEIRALVERLIPRLAAHLADRPEPWTVVHGDYRVDNLLFSDDLVAVVDWQTVVFGPGLADLSYFLGASLPTEVRRTEEDRLVRFYLSQMADAGVVLSWDDVWTGYRRHAFSGLIMAIGASMLVGQTERGDDMFMTMAERHGRHALDLDAEALIPD